MEKCPICEDGQLTISNKPQTQKYGDEIRTVNRLHVQCSSCGDNILKQSNLKTTKKISRDLYAQINGLLTSAEVRKIRKKLNLTQKDAARLCGGGPNAFSRYERGKATPLRSTSNLLRLLARHPEELEFLLGFCN